MHLFYDEAVLVAATQTYKYSSKSNAVFAPWFDYYFQQNTPTLMSTTFSETDLNQRDSTATRMKTSG